MEKTITNFIKSLSIGIVITILVGYFYSDTRYYYNGEEKNYGKHDYEKFIYQQEQGVRAEEFFNFKYGFITGALCFSYFMFFFFENRSLNDIKALYNQLIEKKIHVQLTDYIKFNLKTFFSKSFYKKLAESFTKNFDGRISRSPYFAYSIIINLFYASVSENKVDPDIGIVVFILILLLLDIRLTIMRLHDFNCSGWFSLFKFLPYVIIISTFSLKGYYNIVVPSILLIIMIVIGGIANLLLTFFPGDKRSNKYG